jgi:hypothetical protein
MSGSGLPAMIHTGAQIANEFSSIEVIAIGAPPTAPAGDCTMEVCGQFLCYTVALYGPEIRLSAQPMDTGDALDLLLRSRDNAAGWETVRGVISALERHEIQSLARPIEAWDGRDGANGFVIG